LFQPTRFFSLNISDDRPSTTAGKTAPQVFSTHAEAEIVRDTEKYVIMQCDFCMEALDE
jgi:hypothetical protein